MSLDKILAEYNENSASKTTAIKKQFDLTNYFSTFLPKGVNEATKTIRILPGVDGSPFVPLHIHSHKMDGQWRKFVCPQVEKKEDCPFCELHDALMETGKEEDRKLAYTYKPKKTYVLKIVDREKEGEGVKFWRFTHSRQKDGIYDKIISIFKLAKADLSDPKTGRDLNISIARNANGIPMVSSIVPSFNESPLSEDANEAKLWIEDTRGWEDVYAVKPYDFLRILVEGGEPMWDKDEKKFVNKAEKAKNASAGNDTNELDSELTLGGEATTKPEVKAEIKTESVSEEKVESATTTPVVEDDEDDLPF